MFKNKTKTCKIFYVCAASQNLCQVRPPEKERATLKLPVA